MITRCYGRNDPVYAKHDGVVKSTPQAVLVRIGAREIWFPKSQVRVSDKVVIIPAWLADLKDIGADW